MYEGKHLPGCWCVGPLSPDVDCFCAGPERRLILMHWKQEAAREALDRPAEERKMVSA